MSAKLIKHGSLHGENPPIRIFRCMSPGECVESLLCITVVSERPAVGTEQWLVAGVGNRRSLKYGNGLSPLSRTAKCLAVLHRRIDILGIGTEALAVAFHGAARICVGIRFGL